MHEIGVYETDVLMVSVKSEKTRVSFSSSSDDYDRV